MVTWGCPNLGNYYYIYIYYLYTHTHIYISSELAMGQCDICVATKMYLPALFIRNAGFWRIHAVLVWHMWTLATFLGILKTNAGFCQEEMEGRLSMRMLGACVFKQAKQPWGPVFSWAASKTMYLFPFLLRMMVQITSAGIISHVLDCFGRSLGGWNHPILTWIMVQLTHIFDMCWNHCFPRRSIKYSQSPRKTYQTQYIPNLVGLYLVILGYTWLIFCCFWGIAILGYGDACSSGTCCQPGEATQVIKSCLQSSLALKQEPWAMKLAVPTLDASFIIFYWGYLFVLYIGIFVCIYAHV